MRSRSVFSNPKLRSRSVSHNPKIRSRSISGNPKVGVAPFLVKKWSGSSYLRTIKTVSFKDFEMTPVSLTKHKRFRNTLSGGQDFSLLLDCETIYPEESYHKPCEKNNIYRGKVL